MLYKSLKIFKIFFKNNNLVTCRFILDGRFLSKMHPNTCKIYLMIENCIHQFSPIFRKI